MRQRYRQTSEPGSAPGPGLCSSPGFLNRGVVFLHAASHAVMGCARMGLSIRPGFPPRFGRTASFWYVSCPLYLRRETAKILDKVALRIPQKFVRASRTKESHH